MGTKQQWELLRGFTNELPNSIQVPVLIVKLGHGVLLGSCRGSQASTLFLFV